MKDILTWFFHFKVDQNTVADHYERDFGLIFHFKGLKTWLQSIV